MADVNRNRVWDTGEALEVPAPRGRLRRVQSGQQQRGEPQTGYGSAWRNNNGQGVIGDYGRMITIKAQRPGDAITSGFFYPWRMPMSDGDTANGANDYRALLSDTTCTLAQPTRLDADYRVENGNMVGPTRMAIQDLIRTTPVRTGTRPFPMARGTPGRFVAPCTPTGATARG